MFAFVKNVFDLRNDAKGYCSNIRRPQWKQCEDIGSWFQVLNVIGFFAVVTNATMVCFVGSQLVKISENPDERLAETDMMQTCIPGKIPCEHCFSYDTDPNFPKTCELKEGIWVRLFSQSLWMYSVAVEHIVMLVRVREKEIRGFRGLT